MGSKVGILVLAVAAGVTMLACAPLTRPSATTGGGASGGGGGKRAGANSATAAGPGDREELDDQRGSLS